VFTRWTGWDGVRIPGSAGRKCRIMTRQAKRHKTVQHVLCNYKWVIMAGVYFMKKGLRTNRCKRLE
jgi:hypothetical protein